MEAERPVALVVEDDRAIRTSVHALLVSHGWTVREAATLLDAKAAVGAPDVELVVVDLGLPDGDGIDLIVHARRTSAVPMIVLSARSDEQQKVRALDAGADDYVEKPFRAGEFLARVRVQSRRRSEAAEAPAIVSLGNVEFDAGARLVRKAGRVIHLTPTQYALFAFMVANAGRVLTQRQLLREVWGPGRSEHSHYLRVFMAALRQKLEDDPSQPRLILTETGVGYRLLGGASP